MPPRGPRGEPSRQACQANMFGRKFCTDGGQRRPSFGWDFRPSTLSEALIDATYGNVFRGCATALGPFLVVLPLQICCSIVGVVVGVTGYAGPGSLKFTRTLCYDGLAFSLRAALLGWGIAAVGSITQVVGARVGSALKWVGCIVAVPGWYCGTTVAWFGLGFMIGRTVQNTFAPSICGGTNCDDQVSKQDYKDHAS